MTTLHGKHAFVTGASRGIGAAIADALEANGATVTRSALHACEGVMACDVRDANQVAAAMTAAEADRGPIQILVNNAGIGGSARFLNTRIEDLDVMLDVNLKGAWRCCQTALPSMLANGWGRIVNVASISGLEGFRYISAYSISKHALVGLTRNLAAEFAGQGIAVAAICPGYVDTDILADTIANVTARTGIPADEARARIAALNPDGRILNPIEVAARVVSLCLAETTEANGQIISIP